MLYEAGDSSKFIRILQNIYQQSKVQIRLKGNVKTKSIEITQGALQGDSISPLLFALLIHDIVDIFKKEGYVGIKRNINLLLFADDLTLIADNPIELQNMLLTLYKHCREKALEVNTKKTLIMKFKKARRSKQDKIFKYRDSPLIYVKEYVHLGVVFSQNGSFKTNTDRALSKGMSALGTIWQILGAGRNTSWEARITLFEAMVISTVMYGVNIWGLNHAQELEKIQTTFHKRLLQLPLYTPGYVVHLETGASKLECIVAKRALQFWIKILKADSTRYIRIMYNRLKTNDTILLSTNKLNWYSLHRILLAKYNHEYLLNGEDPNSIVKALPVIDGALRNKSFKEDVSRAKQSRFSLLYQEMKFLESPCIEPYLLFAVPIHYIRLLASCRMSGKLCLNISCNKTSYKIDDKDDK